MKKFEDNKEFSIHFNKKELKSQPQSISSQKKDVKKNFSVIQTKYKETQPKDIQFEVLNFGYEKPDSKNDLGSFSLSEASTSSFNTDISNGTQILKVFNTYRVKKKSGDIVNYPVERIELSQEQKSVEEVKSPLDVNFSEIFSSDLDLKEEKSFRLDEIKQILQATKEQSPVYKKSFKSKIQGCCFKLRPRFLNFKSHIYESPSRNPTRKNQIPLEEKKKGLRKEKEKKTEAKNQSSHQKVKIKKKKIPKTGVVPIPVLSSEGILKNNITIFHLIPQLFVFWSYSMSRLNVNVEEDLQTKRELLEFYIYIIFLVFITTIALSMVSSNMFYFTSITSSLFFDNKGTPAFQNISNGSESLSNKLKTLRESRTSEDFWAFAETTLLDLLYWNFYYSRLDPARHKSEDDRKMLYENQILGVARMRQLRVKSDSCKIHPKVQRFFNDCYYYYSIFSEETKPIKQGMENSSTSTAWVYTEADKLKSSYYWGEISIYGGGGYYLDLATTKDGALKMIKELKENFWISKATRALFIDFNIYNANANLFCLCKIALEFPPVGGIIPVADFQSLKIIRYLSPFDFFILGCEFLFTMFIIYYTWQTLRALIRRKLLFFLFFWNYLDIAILILSYIYIILSIIRYIYSSALISVLSKRYDEYTEFSSVKKVQVSYNNTIAVLLFFCWIKLFKYLNFNLILLEFKITLAKSLIDILGFFPMFLTMFLAFAFLAYLLFGNQVKTYNTLWLSFLTLLQAFLGEFYYTDIVESNRILGPLFYIAYIFFIFFVLLNVFIAIINDAYTSVKSQVIYEKPKTGEYMKRGLVNIFTCGRGHFSKKRRLRDSRKKFLFQEIQKALQRQLQILNLILPHPLIAGFSKTEIKIFFCKYNINFNNFLDGDTRRRILEDLELKRIDFSESLEQAQINFLKRKLNKLSNKMEDFEIHLQPIVDKIEILLERL